MKVIRSANVHVMKMWMCRNRLRWMPSVGLVGAASSIAQAGGSGVIDPTDPAALNSNLDVDVGADQRPSIATSANGTLIAVWDTDDTFGGTIPVAGNGRNIAFARSNDDGVTWSAPVPLTSNGNRQSSSPAIATDGNGVWIVAFASRIPTGSDGNAQDIFATVSLDDGLTWSSAVPLDSAYAASSLGEEQSPSIVSLGNGEWVIAWESTTALIVSGVDIGNDSDILVSRSESNGATWTSPVPLRLGYAAGANGADTGVELAADDEGRVVAVWSSTDNLARFNEFNLGSDRDILISRSSSRGINWTFPEPLNSFAAIDVNTDEDPSIATDGLGAWIVVWDSQYNGGPGNPFGADRDIWYAVSVKEGDLWSDSAPLVASFAAQGANNSEPTIRTDTLGNWVVVWQSVNPLGLSGQPNIGPDDDILYSFSNTTGSTWTFPSLLNTNAPSDGASSDTFPVMGVDRTGRWIVSWVSNNPSFGGPDSDLLYATFLSPIVEVYWINPTGGTFSTPSNWDGGRVPEIFDRAAFDDTLVPQSLNSTYTVTVDAPTLTGRLAVRTGLVRMNLVESYELDAAASKASQPPLIVGEYSDVPPVTLSVERSGSGSEFKSLRAEAASIARRAGSTGTVQVSGNLAAVALTVGPTSVGERGVGTLRAQDGSTMDVGGDIIVGENAGSNGRIEVRGNETVMGFGGTTSAPARIVIGGAGSGTWSVGDPAQPGLSPTARQLVGAPVSAIVVGEQSSSDGTIRVFGDGATLTTFAREFIVGAQGDGSILIGSGGLLESSSPDLVGLAQSAGSTARVDIRDAGSMWFESSQAINIGILGQAFVGVGEGASIGSSSSVNVLRNGVLVGNGTIDGPLVNTGIVRVGEPILDEEAPGDFGVLRVEGDYSQLGAPLSGAADSGSVFLRVGGTERGVTYDAMDVIGDAFLGGGLFVTLDPTYAAQGGPAIGETFTLIDATVRDPNQPIFDVALVPGFLDNRLLRVEYQGGEVILEVSTLGRVLGFAEPEGSESIVGTPAGIAVANFDRDPDNLPDLVIPVAGATRSLYVLLNRGVDPVTNEWLGFNVSVQSLEAPGIPPGVPVAIGVGDFLARNGQTSDLILAFENGDSGSAIFFDNVDASPGLFQPGPVTYPIGATPRGLAVGDLNGDGLSDVAIVSYNSLGGGSDARVDRLLAQVANVHAQATPTSLPGAGRPEDVDIDDLDNDKDLVNGPIAGADIVIADSGLEAIIVLRNDGNGGFGAPPIVIDASAPINELSLADLNEDGLVDIVALSREDGVAAVVINRVMDGDFAPSVPLDLGPGARSLIVADLGGSPSTDIAAIVDGKSPNERIIRTLRGEVAFDAITFSDGPEYPTDAGALLLAAVDVNGGEGADLVVVGGPEGLRGVGFAQALLNAECLGDATGDGEVGFADLNAVLSTFGQTGTNLIGDVDRNGVVSFGDLNTVLGRFGQRCR